MFISCRISINCATVHLCDDAVLNQGHSFRGVERRPLQPRIQENIWIDLKKSEFARWLRSLASSCTAVSLRGNNWMASTNFGILDLWNPWNDYKKLESNLISILVQIFELYDFTSMPLDSDRAAPHEQRLAETVLTSPGMCAGSC